MGRISHDFVLVLDDYHLIDTHSIHEGMAFLLAHLPRQMHLVIMGRADPPLPLARLRGAVSWSRFGRLTSGSHPTRRPRS